MAITSPQPDIFLAPIMLHFQQPHFQDWSERAFWVSFCAESTWPARPSWPSMRARGLQGSASPGFAGWWPTHSRSKRASRWRRSRTRRTPSNHARTARAPCGFQSQDPHLPRMSRAPKRAPRAHRGRGWWGNSIWGAPWTLISQMGA